MSLLMILWDSRLMTNTRIIGFMNGTKTCHGYTKNHGLTLDWREDGYCNGGNIPGAYIVGNTLRYQDLEWYDALKDSELKEETLRNKAIMEGLINEDVESNDEGWKSWDDFENTDGDHNEWEYENEHEDNERHELCGNKTHELPICNIRIFEMIKYSFGQDEEYGYSKNRKKTVKTGQTRTRDGKECTRAGDLIARRIKSQLQSTLGLPKSTH
ncbi:hypothetical protein Tco_1438227 [Tanacetum coccineum]